MKFIIWVPLFFIAGAHGQNLQLHYDFRHTTDPQLNSGNFPTFSFEYYKEIDTLKTGSFLLKMNAQLNGRHNNIGQVFTQISQSLKFWKPNIYTYFNYSGGLGVTQSAYGYYMPSSLGIGATCPFQFLGAWISAGVSLRVTVFDKPSYDPQVTLYFGRGFKDYRCFAAGSFVFWTENRNQGNDYTNELKGKKFAFFGDPQCWIRIKKGLSAGSRFNVYYHVLSDENRVQVYPTLGLKYQF